MAEATALDRRFFIKSSNSPEFVLDVERRSTEPGARIILWNQKKDSDSRNQLFYLDEPDNRIRSALNDFCLDIKLAGKKILVLNPYEEKSSTQQWEFRGGYIRNLCTKDLLGVQEMPDKGMAVIFSMYANEKQEWLTENSIPRYFALQNEHNKKLLDVCQKKTDPGTPVIAWPPDKLFKKPKGNQMWFENNRGQICTRMTNHFAIDIPEGKKNAVINPGDGQKPWQQWVYRDGYIINTNVANHILAVAENDVDVIVTVKDATSTRQKWIRNYV